MTKESKRKPERTKQPRASKKTAVRVVGQGWAEAAARCAARGDDKLIDTPPTRFQIEEWRWE